ncbi:MAG: PD-(D/E)XK nuclease family protein, partial [Pseudomonadota bacterium]|nr:PD-(D/E)XK nuclease family protein [Pseudomonadota bacterium]
IPATHAERVASKIGTLIHKVFETYARSNSKPDYLAKLEKVIAFWELNLRPLQLPSMERKRILNQMKATVLKTLSDPKLNWIFDNEHREGACELRISRQQNGYTQQFVIDRTFVDQDDTRWIIDYKTSQQQPEQTESEFIQSQTEKYRSQLENYRDLMKATENRTTRLALLLTDIPAVVEIEPN